MMKRISIFSLLASITALAASGCGDNNADQLLGRGGPGSVDEDAGVTPATAPPGVPKTCGNAQKSYVGFGQVKLEATRLDVASGLDRTRAKPYGMLIDDYKRVLGVTPSVLGESGATFGQAPDRWFTEPAPTAVSLYQAYRVAFEGCLEYTKTDPKYAAAPTAASAATECTAMERKFWSQVPIPDEVAACAGVATSDSATETVPAGGMRPTAPRRRWAYACASVLTAPGFMNF